MRILLPIVAFARAYARTFVPSAIVTIGVIVFALARGGHGGGHDSNFHETFDNPSGNHQSWCEVSPDCNGWNQKMAYYRMTGIWPEIVWVNPREQRAIPQIPAQRYGAVQVPQHVAVLPLPKPRVLVAHVAPPVPPVRHIVHDLPQPVPGSSYAVASSIVRRDPNLPPLIAVFRNQDSGLN